MVEVEEVVDSEAVVMVAVVTVVTIMKADNIGRILASELAVDCWCHKPLQLWCSWLLTEDTSCCHR
jgi:hypothetical protein